MAIGDPYATLADLKDRLGDISDAEDDDILNGALASASDGVEDFTRRQFNKETVASARVYYPVGFRIAHVDDFHTDTDLVIATDESGDGSFSTTWSGSDFQLEPLNGMRGGQPGWPFWHIRAVGDRRFPLNDRAALQVTAQWGWGAVPDQVREATLILAEDLAKLKDTPFGVGGFGDFGRIRARENPHVIMRLKRYRRDRRITPGRVVVG